MANEGLIWLMRANEGLMTLVNALRVNYSYRAHAF